MIDVELSNVNELETDILATGPRGENGITPTIGENGNWFIGDTDTGLPSRGPQGEPGEGVTLEEVTAITGNTEELQTESKIIVGAINEVLNNSGGSQEIFYLYNSSYKHSVTFTKTSGLEEIQKLSDAYESGNKPILVVRYNDGIMELYPIMYKNGDNLEGKVMTIDNNNIRFIEKRILITRTLTDGVYTVKNISTTASSFNMLASKTYVDTAIANAITTTLEGSY